MRLLIDGKKRAGYKQNDVLFIKKRDEKDGEKTSFRRREKRRNHTKGNATIF